MSETQEQLTTTNNNEKEREVPKESLEHEKWKKEVKKNWFKSLCLYSLKVLPYVSFWLAFFYTVQRSDILNEPLLTMFRAGLNGGLYGCVVSFVNELLPSMAQPLMTPVIIMHYTYISHWQQIEFYCVPLFSQ